MTYKLFLDDLREVADIYPNTQPGEFEVARNFYMAEAMVVMYGCPSFISFDNDLGENEKEGYDFAKVLVEMDMEGIISIPNDFTFHVHSANCKAWDNISCYLNNYLKQR